MIGERFICEAEVTELMQYVERIGLINLILKFYSKVQKNFESVLIQVEVKSIQITKMSVFESSKLREAITK